MSPQAHLKTIEADTGIGATIQQEDSANCTTQSLLIEAAGHYAKAMGVVLLGRATNSHKEEVFNDVDRPLASSSLRDTHGESPSDLYRHLMQVFFHLDCVVNLINSRRLASINRRPSPPSGDDEAPSGESTIREAQDLDDITCILQQFSRILYYQRLAMNRMLNPTSSPLLAFGAASSYSDIDLGALELRSLKATTERVMLKYHVSTACDCICLAFNKIMQEENLLSGSRVDSSPLSSTGDMSASSNH